MAPNDEDQDYDYAMELELISVGKLWMTRRGLTAEEAARRVCREGLMWAYDLVLAVLLGEIFIE